VTGFTSDVDGAGSTAPSETAPSETAPSETAPSETAPSETAPSETLRVAVVGDRRPEFAQQDTIETALHHSADALGANLEIAWFATPMLETGAAEHLDHADAVWCAPGSPYLSIDGALEGIRFAREARRPFLGTCAGFQHGVIEIARNLCGVEDAHHAEYGPGGPSAPLFIDELLCSLVGQTMRVELVDSETRRLYGACEAVEQYYCRFGLDEQYLPLLKRAGLEVAGVDIADSTTRIMRLAPHPYFYLTLFVPQAASTPERPHPIITGYLAATLRSKRARAGS
jgi:CTP synthase (UTP-ammonia lyase)